MDLIKSMTGTEGALGTGIGAAYLLGACWVASELYGGWHEPKTEYARYYIGNIAPKWFKNLYIKYGERFAKFIKNKTWLKNIIRPLFDNFALIGRRASYGIS